MKQSNTAKHIALSSCIVDRAFNVRDDEAYRVEALKDDLAFQGQQEAALAERIRTEGGDDKFRLIRGSRRATAMLELAAAGVIDPKTSKPFASIYAFIVEDLTDAERVALLIDQGQRRGLNHAELQRAMERFFSVDYSEKDIAIVLRDLIDTNYPPKRNAGNDPDELLRYRRGLIQTAKMAWRAPDVLHDAWMDKLHGKHQWPNKAELNQFVKVFTVECAESNEYNKSKPGPKFLAAWDEYIAKQDEAAENGEKRAKSSAAMNNQQMADAKTQCNSITLKTVFDIARSEAPRENLAVLDKIIVEHFEKTMPEDVRKALLALGAKKPEPAATEPATEEPAAV